MSEIYSTKFWCFTSPHGTTVSLEILNPVCFIHLKSGELVHKFLPFLMSLMVDSNLHSFGNKTCDTDENSAAAEGPLQFLDYFVEITSTNSVAFTLAWCYLLHVIKQKDR